MDSLLKLGPAPLLAFAVMFALLTGAMILIVATRAEMREISDSYNTLLNYLGNDQSRDLLQELASLIRDIERDGKAAEREISHLYEMLAGCVQKVAIVRYNAFPNVGSDQSFSLALLNETDDGVVITGIFGRDSSTTYAKPVKSAVSDYTLTDEEVNVIRIARSAN